MTLRTPFVAALFATAAAACSTGAAPSEGSTSPTSPSSTGTASVVTVALTPTGCIPDKGTVPAGAVTFNISNEGAEAVSELELKQGEQTVGEKENLTPGLTGTFTVQLAPGRYILECPGATTDEAQFIVN